VVLEDGFGGSTRGLARLRGQAQHRPVPLLTAARTARARAGIRTKVTVHGGAAAPAVRRRADRAAPQPGAAARSQAPCIDSVHETAKPLAGKRVLIVDDDMRNIFALATVLEEHGMDIVWADNGRERSTAWPTTRASRWC
jgi:PleD family two-component response regulator